MVSFFEVLLISFAGGILSLIGGFILLSRKDTAIALAKYATPFAAGALLAAAFLDLLKQSAAESSIEIGLYGALIGMLFFFLLENSLHWFHHHHEHDDEGTDPTASLIIIGDTLHNFIDGIAIGSALLVDTTTGIIVAIAVAAHEIPQEVGDFGLLLKKSMKRRWVILVNVASAFATVVAALLVWWLGGSISLPMGFILGVVAGFFIYIAASDIIPTIHETKEKKLARRQVTLLLLGVLVVGLITAQTHEIIEDDHTVNHTGSYVSLIKDEV